MSSFWVEMLRRRRDWNKVRYFLVFLKFCFICELFWFSNLLINLLTTFFTRELTHYSVQDLYPLPLTVFVDFNDYILAWNLENIPDRYTGNVLLLTVNLYHQERKQKIITIKSNDLLEVKSTIS